MTLRPRTWLWTSGPTHSTFRHELQIQPDVHGPYEAPKSAADVADADIVYCFATCFSPEIVGALEAKLAAEMKPGARLVLVSKQMETDAFEPFGPNGGYVSVEQAHSKWNLDCYIYEAASADRGR